MNLVDWRSVWFLHSKLLISDLKYWLSVAGFDSDDHKLSSYLYFVYLVLIFGAWISLMVFYLSNALINLALPLQYFLDLSFPELITTLGSMSLLFWSLYSIYQSTRQSPIEFSEIDGYLICQTPITRSCIVLVRLVRQWLMNMLPFMALASVSGLSFLELEVLNGFAQLSLSNILVAGIRPWFIVLPVHLSLFTLSWIVGFIRLRKENSLKKLMLAIRLVITSLALLLIVLISKSFIIPADGLNFQMIFRFINIPLIAAFNGTNWTLWVTMSGFMMVLIVAVLIRISKYLNLGRAAQETSRSQFQWISLFSGNTAAIQELIEQNRLGTEHKPSKLPGFSSGGALLWKDVIQFFRTLSYPHLWSGLNIILMPVAYFLVPDYKIGSIFIFYWTLQVVQYTSERFRNDLGQWWIIKSLPVPRRQIILFDILRPSMVIMLLTWTACWIGIALNVNVDPSLFIVVPFLIVGIALFAAFDLLRQSRSENLLNGRKPTISPLGLGLSLLWVVIFGGLNRYISNTKFQLILIPLSILVGAVMIRILLWFSESQLRNL